MSQTSLITNAARLALLNEVAQLGIDIDTHIQGGLDQHNTQVIIDEPFVSLSGDTLSSKTLKLGVTIGGINAYILLPAIEA